ncbi:YqaE/Pmp3 family membrane protein [Legionella yabuuchiae]|uniref:YqaE/Pmp3 family membrane protein n=1 Tax=Legionella yabuuchiae TaxID=376727 RepID=UPI001055B484|nr:YqaE/Pmp3 family membrane protein [Legionella yabuuchiae]
MKHVFMSILAIFLPWVVLLLNDNPGGALITLVLQATLIGWIPASMWAWRVVHETREREKAEQKEKKEKKPS